MKKMLLVAAIIGAYGHASAALPFFGGAGPDVAVNEFQKEVDQGNVTTARKYLAATFNDYLREDERHTQQMLASAKQTRERGGLQYPVVATPCEILGETAQCLRVLKYKNGHPTINTRVSLVKVDGKWLIKRIEPIKGEATK